MMSKNIKEVEEKAKVKWNRLSELLKMIRNFTDEDVEMFIKISKEQNLTEDEDGLRRELNNIRFNHVL